MGDASCPDCPGAAAASRSGTEGRPPPRIRAGTKAITAIAAPVPALIPPRRSALDTLAQPNIQQLSRSRAAPPARPLKPQDNPGRRTKQVQFRDMVLNFLVHGFTLDQSTLADRRHRGVELRRPKNRCTGPSFPSRRNASGPAPCGRRSPWARLEAQPAAAKAPWGPSPAGV